MKTFRTYQLAKDFYLSTRDLKLAAPMKDQFQRASLSIILNLSEGSAKPTTRDRKKFYYIAFDSLREVQCMLELLDHDARLQKADVLAAHLYRLCRS